MISHEEIGKVADRLVKYAGSCAPDSKEALALLIKYIGAEATYEVIGVFILFLILCGESNEAKEIKRLNQLLNEKDKEIAFLKKAAAFFAKEID